MHPAPKVLEGGQMHSIQLPCRNTCMLQQMSGSSMIGNQAGQLQVGPDIGKSAASWLLPAVPQSRCTLTCEASIGKVVTPNAQPTGGLYDGLGATEQHELAVRAVSCPAATDTT